MMRRLIAGLFFAAALPVLGAAGMDMAGILAWTIPEGEVARVEVAGQTVWPSIPYVTNGLMAYWDGKWNAGLGVHDENATVWKDLSGSGFDATQRVSTGWVWANDAYVGTTNNGHGFKPSYYFTRLFDSCQTNHTVEIVSSASAIQRMTIMGGYQHYAVNIEYYLQSGNLKFRWYYNGTPSSTADTTQSRKTYSVMSTPSRIIVYYNGVQAGISYENRYSKPDVVNSFVIGGEQSRSEMSMVGEICAIRFYNRPLSSAEIARNAAIDALRFGITP